MERIQKYIASCGAMSRRSAEKEILAGNVTVNGEKARIGMSVSEKDDIRIGGVAVKPESAKITLLLNKPSGYVTSMKDELGRKTVNTLIDLPYRLYPAGRLDKDSEGMLIMTNDGDLAQKLTHPKSEKKKVYHVFVRGNVENGTLDSLRAMRTLEGEKINPVEIELLKRSPQSSCIRFTLTEGKNRQIRRMCQAVSLSVTQLRRVQIGALHLGKLAPGEYRKLTKQEIGELLK